MRRRAPARERMYWQRRPKRAYDIALLRPSSLPKQLRFETRSDAECNAARTIERLTTIDKRWSKALAKSTRACTGDTPCGKPICAECARSFRRWLTGEALRLVREDGREAVILTLLICEFSDTSPSLNAVKDLIRKRIVRAGLKDIWAIGGIELAYKPTLKLFVLHAHICLVGATKSEVKPLRAAYASAPVESAFVCQELRDHPRQLSYLLKVTSYVRVGQQSGPQKSKAVPLPMRHFETWAQWVSDQRFEDLMFLHGARRQRGKIDVSK